MCRALEQAVKYAAGTAFDLLDACYPIDALGLAAYELWRDLLADGMSAGAARAHAGILGWSRGAAAAFCTGMAAAVPAWGAGLREAAALYAAEAQQLEALHRLCDDSGLQGAARGEAVALLDGALATEREAVRAVASLVGA